MEPDAPSILAADSTGKVNKVEAKFLKQEES